MIRDFWIQNYLSIRDKQELNFVTKGPESELVTEVAKGVFVNKLAILYGANASGKSNILLAMDKVFHLLITSETDVNKKISGAYPFALTKDEPIKMHVSFYAKGFRYDYDVDFTADCILKEMLYYYPNDSKALFYERTFVGNDIQADIKFGSSLKLLVKTQESIRENTLNNHSVLSVCSKNSFKEDIEPFVVLYNWIMNHYHNIDGDLKRGIVEELKEVYKDERKHKFYNTMLQKADLNIIDFKPIVEDRKIPQEIRERILKQNFSEAVKEELLRSTKETISFTNNSENGSFEVPLELQSEGTQAFIQILGTLYDLITNNHVYFLDELGEDLHYDLLLYYLNVFLFNSEKSQLIITSQETALLAQDLINENRGLVWFVEKNKETASSEYARGDSFGLHKNLSLSNSYKIGRLGAKPELGSIFIDLDE